MDAFASSENSLVPRFVVPFAEKGGDNAVVLQPNPRPSSSLISEMMSKALLKISVDASATFSDASEQPGGLTVAIEAGVPEHIVWTQNWNAQNRAARCYVRLTNPVCHYDT